MSDLVDDIKVEVQLPPQEGDNLITNTSGQYGAWQWAPGTSVSGLTISGDPEARTITATRNGTAGYTTVVSDYVPVTPGMYANARVDLVAITSGHKVTLALQFYDSSYAVDSWQYSSPSSTLDTLAFSSVQVPADVAWMQIFVILDKTADPLPGSGSANANASVTFTKAMVTELSETGTPSIEVTNLVPNGGFSTTTSGWAAGTNISSVQRVQVGSDWYLRGHFVDGVTLSSAEYCYINGSSISTEAGENYSLRIDGVVLSAAGHDFTSGVLVRWYDDPGNQIGPDVRFTDNDVTPGWHQVWRIITAPAGSTRLRLFPFVRHHGLQGIFSDDWYMQIDSVSLVKSSVLMPYFDGDTPDTSSQEYAWTGTAGNSPSTRTSVGAVDYVEPDEQFIDITGGYNQFTIERDELDISTCNGTIVSPTLSPARADSVVVPGRGLRVWAYRPETAAFERLFTGKLGACSVEYDPLEDEKRGKLKISVTSTGRESQLAQASRPGVTRTPANLGALVLAQAGVPWNVNGTTNIVGGVVTIADNESATALDQVALTRDTTGGYAWVDPEGTLQFHTGSLVKSTGPDTLGPADYSAAGLKVGFSTDNLINSVNVTRLIRASDGSTEERVAGQTYEDPASIRKWGRHSANITIASLPSETSDAATVADRLLTGNATPKIAVEEVVINSADERDHAFHDLYDLVTVTADTTDGEIVEDLRIARIKHEFTTGKRPGGQGRWHTTFGFKVNGTVAAPAIQPPITAATSTAWPWLHMSKNGSTMSVPHNSPTVISGWNVVTNQGFGTVAGASAVIQRAGWYQVDVAGILFASGGAGRRLLRVMLNGGEWARVELGNSSSATDTLALSKIIYAAEGDTISAEVLQTSGGGSLNLNASSPRFSLYLLRDA